MTGTISILVYVFGWVLNIWGLYDRTANVLGIIFWGFMVVDLLLTAYAKRLKP